VSAFRIKFTLHGDIGLFTSPPSDSFELALRRAEDLQRPDISAQRLLDSWHDDDPDENGRRSPAPSGGFSWGGDSAGKRPYCAAPDLKGLNSLAAGLRVSGIMFVGFDVGSDIASRHQSGVMTELRQLTRPEMRSAGLCARLSALATKKAARFDPSGLVAE
jgi:hypothetical protein